MTASGSVQRGQRSQLASSASHGGLDADELVELVVLAVLRLDLVLGDRGDAILEEPARCDCAQTLVDRDLALGVRTDHQRLVLVEARETPALVFAQLLVDLDVLATRKAHDTAGLEAMQSNLA